jgi:hypothetical protein
MFLPRPNLSASLKASAQSGLFLSPPPALGNAAIAASRVAVGRSYVLG